MSEYLLSPSSYQHVDCPTCSRQAISCVSNPHFIVLLTGYGSSDEVAISPKIGYLFFLLNVYRASSYKCK